jgi:hypothetical protein
MPSTFFERKMLQHFSFKKGAGLFFVPKAAPSAVAE